MPKPPGITNAQAKFLGQLCRELGVPYMGNGLSRFEASTIIDELIKAREGQRQAQRERARNIVSVKADPAQVAAQVADAGGSRGRARDRLPSGRNAENHSDPRTETRPPRRTRRERDAA